MKKLLIAFLLSLTCACTVAGATACKAPADSSSDWENGEATLTVDFVEGEGYCFETDFAEGKLFKPGETVSFRLDVNAFYTGYAVVYLNGRGVEPLDDDGNYQITIQENAEITVSGIKKDESAMLGTGSFDDPYVVTRPVDLLYMAEQVNAGNVSYTTGTYVLANDIDCGGEELEIIGDLSTNNSYFAGCFVSDADPVTGERYNFTISNFTINSDKANYVGLFGAVYTDLSVTNSALFYGISLDNFTINAKIEKDAQVDNYSISAGGLIGYGVGANLWLCNATNGAINVYADDSYFSFVGGLIGYQQAFYSASTSSFFPSEIAYSVVDVDVRVLRGMGLYVGGISGYLSSNVPMNATAFIHNSYSTGTVSGGLRTGGIAGGLGPYTSVSNVYSAGSVSAKSEQSPSDPLVNDTQYCYSYAGGIVGYAENDTVVNDSFSTSKLSATSKTPGCSATHAIVGGGDNAGVASAGAQKYVVDNCLDTVDLADTAFLTEKLGWGDYDWVFKKDQLPTIYYGASEGAVTATLTAYYVCKDGTKITVEDGDESTEDDKFEIKFLDTDIQSLSAYNPLGNYFGGGLTLDIEADNGYRAYGYFFDEACTKKVPYSYVPEKNVTLYIGFADPTPILHTYALQYKDKANELSLTFKENGTVAYSDGKTEQEAYYFYDGESVLIQAARLARYYDGEIIVNENDTTSTQDANFDMNRYGYYDFAGTFQEGVLSLYDGTYFTKDAPLVAHVIDDENLVAPDPFEGSWTKSATVNKVYTFDGNGNWTYVYTNYVREGFGYEENNVEQARGEYTKNGDVLSFTHKGVDYTAEIVDGVLHVTGDGKTQLYYAEGSYVGTWKTDGLTLALHGIGANGIGEAIVTYTDEEGEETAVYELVYEQSETDGYVALYYPHDDYVKDTLFGYFTYNVAYNMLLATLPDQTTGSTMQLSLTLLDDYNGEWISDADEFIDVEFRFNGNGLYDFLYGYAGMEGSLTLIKDGVESTYTYTLDSILQGKFDYDGKVYTMVYDEDTNSIILTSNDSNDQPAELERKDALANVDFVDMDGVHYAFDGRSNLSMDGILTVGDKTYTYLIDQDGEGWLLKEGANTVGTMVQTDNCYTLTINGVAKELYIANEFMGTWAVGGEYGLFEIGPTDLEDTIQANFLGHHVQITQLEPTLLTFRYRDGYMPYTYYVYIMEDEALGYDVLVLSQYGTLLGAVSGGYSICTKANEFYGDWTRNDGEFSIMFDGLSSGSLANGAAALYRNNKDHATPYYYTIGKNDHVMMWSQAALGGSIIYYQLEKVTATADLNASDVFVQRDESGNIISKFGFRRVVVDSLYMVEATDLDDGKTVYFFDGRNVGDTPGSLYVGGQVAYNYVIGSFNTDNTVYLTLTKDGAEYFAVLDYSTPENFTLKIEASETTTPDNDDSSNEEPSNSSVEENSSVKESSSSAESGCGSVVGSAAVALTMLAVGTICLKGKKDE